MPSRCGANDAESGSHATLVSVRKGPLLVFSVDVPECERMHALIAIREPVSARLVSREF